MNWYINSTSDAKFIKSMYVKQYSLSKHSLTKFPFLANFVVSNAKETIYCYLDFAKFRFHPSIYNRITFRAQKHESSKHGIFGGAS